MNVNSSLFSINPLIESNDTHKIVLPACLRKPPHTTSLEYGLAPTLNALLHEFVTPKIFRIEVPRPQDHNYSDGYNSKIVNLIMLDNNVILPDKIDVMDLSGRCHCRCAVLQIIK
ncbi:uncharacterized protein OCT59_027952 [Rhizophagus irregularis]|uniref:Uncharacterized protein n=2 Tax=Rhizophagus irregularis TaxID=588596 RepID=A0A915ZRJ3_9GLOM|nr:hypothetical protein OCT59_027952 [Rhizophagus irregularis]CAB5364832.1 unnamed protein product [Rhizophagus irregularis]CAB5388195.1 unnamed protein product [Rhizophagus irregularis]